MLQLIPEWAHHYGEFWRAIRVRNLWFIKLRYLAVLMLIGFLTIGETLLDFKLTSAQIKAVIIISFSILLYNIIIHLSRKYAGTDPNKFNCLHLSLIQIVLDLIALMVLVYYTGIMESPLYMFFIFHMIIGSLILPGFIVYINAGIVSICFSTLATLQLGSDVPFFIKAKPSYGKSRGEILEPLPFEIRYPILIVNPGIHISTKEAFNNITPKENQIDLKEIFSKETIDYNLIREKVTNDFENYVFNKYPEIAEIKRIMYNNNALFALMSGSGSTVFGIFNNVKVAESVIDLLPNNYFCLINNPDH